jgi:hypothetical protein
VFDSTSTAQSNLNRSEHNPYIASTFALAFQYRSQVLRYTPRFDTFQRIV